MARNPYTHHINPRVRAYGKARIDIARRARTRQDWDSLWKRPQFSFPFHWGAHWKQCIEYRVEDYAAEVGFFIDVLGLPVNAFNEYSAMFTGPQHEFYFAVVPIFEDQEPTPPDALRLQFLVEDIFQVADDLAQRGIEFEQPPQPVAEGSSYFVATFRTPHGIPIDLCGMVNLDELEVVEPETETEEDVVVEEEEEVEEPEAEAEAELPPPAAPRYPSPQPDPDDVFVEVRERPSQNRPAGPSQTVQRPASQPVPRQAPAQRSSQSSYLTPPPPELTYGPPEPEEGDTPPPGQGRTYRAISFGDERI